MHYFRHYNKMLRKLRLETGIYLLTAFRQVYLTFTERPWYSHWTKIVTWQGGKFATLQTDLCGKTQTQIHALNNWIGAINDGRYKWRRDSILKTILCYICSSNEHQVFADVEGCNNCAAFLASSVPVIVVITNDILDAIELTVCFETNFQKSRKYKIKRYKTYQTKLLVIITLRNYS